MIQLTEPNVPSLIWNVTFVLKNKFDCFPLSCGNSNLHAIHERVKQMFSWERIAKETIFVYESVLKKPQLTFLQKLYRYQSVGNVARYFVCFLATTLHFYAIFLELWQPMKAIDGVQL